MSMDTSSTLLAADAWSLTNYVSLVAAVSSVLFWIAAMLWWYDVALRLRIFIQRRLLGNKNFLPLPPGRMGLPFVGDLPFILMIPDADKLGVYRSQKMSTLGDVYCHSNPPFSRNCITLAGYDAVKWGLSMENRGLEGCWPKSTSTLLGPNSVSVLTGKAHKRMRSALIPVFQPLHLSKYVEAMNDIVRSHLAQEWTPSLKGSTTKRIVVRDEMKALTFKIIADLVLGLDLEKERSTVNELEQLFDVWFKGLFMPTVQIPGNPYIAALKAHGRIKTILLPLIEQRRRSSQNGEKGDVMDILLAPTKDDAGNVIHLTNEEIFDTLVNLLFAGSDTSTCSMTWVLKFLSEYPDVYHRLRQEHLDLQEKNVTERETHITWEEMESLRYTNQVIFEVLRMHPPVGGSFRNVKKDLIYNGYLIPIGYTVAFDFQSMTRDPKYHKESALFNPDRFATDTQMFSSAMGGLNKSGFTPFGGGARMCIGYRMAIAEMNVFIHHMILDYAWSPSSDTQEKVTYFPLPMPVDGVPMDVKKRQDKKE